MLAHALDEVVDRHPPVGEVEPASAGGEVRAAGLERSLELRVVTETGTEAAAAEAAAEKAAPAGAARGRSTAAAATRVGPPESAGARRQRHAVLLEAGDEL